MANHPQPGQAQPSDPWQDAPLWASADATGAPFGEPSVHIADPYSPPTGYPPAAAPAPVWGPPTPAKKGLSMVAITLITAAAVIVAGGAIIGGYVWSQDSGGGIPAAQSGTPTQHATSASPSPTEQDITTARVGQCLENRGTLTKLDMHIVDCAPGTFQVLIRYDNTVDVKVCDNKDGVTQVYHYSYGDTKLVYCLKMLK